MQKLGTNKVIIWGHPEHSHTHSYIHYGFFKALKYLEYDVIWVNDSEESRNINLENCIVISEVGCKKFLPIVDSAKYLIHNLYDDFIDTNQKNFYNFLVYHENYSWDNTQEKVDDFFWYDKKTKTPVIMWGTDLLPYEIDNIEPSLYDEERDDVYFVGTIQGNNLIKFAHICADNGKNFINLGGYTGFNDEENGISFFDYEKSIRAVRDSYISFDIREEQHLNNGYVPCRIFKNMSYGKWVGTNSLKVKKFFQNRVTINDNLEQLYFNIVDDYKRSTIDILSDNMNYIQKNHTYLNRVKSLFSIL